MKERRFKFAGAVLLLAFFILRPLAAQETNANDSKLHSLWKVQGKSNVVYLMGSIHVLKADNYPLAPALENAYSNSQVAVFETDIDKMSDPTVQVTLAAKMLLPAGETFKQHLSDATYAAFLNHAKDSGMPAEMLEMMKPSMAAMTLDLLELTKLGVDPENGLDKYFDGKARKDGKTVIGLETVDFQMGLLTGFTPEEEELVMKSTLEDMDTTKKDFAELLAAWQTGDSAALQKLLNDATSKTPTLYKRLLTDRNKSWIPKIEEMLNGGKNVVVIVGAAHLVGDEGVVELLKKKGWKTVQQ